MAQRGNGQQGGQGVHVRCVAWRRGSGAQRRYHGWRQVWWGGQAGSQACNPVSFSRSPRPPRSPLRDILKPEKRLDLSTQPHLSHPFRVTPIPPSHPPHPAPRARPTLHAVRCCSVGGAAGHARMLPPWPRLYMRPPPAARLMTGKSCARQRSTSSPLSKRTAMMKPLAQPSHSSGPASAMQCSVTPNSRAHSSLGAPGGGGGGRGRAEAGVGEVGQRVRTGKAHMWRA